MNRDKATQLVRQANSMLEQGRLGGAEQFAEQALAIDKRNADAMAVLGRAATERDQYDIAIDWLKKAMSIDRKNALLPCTIGTTLIAAGRFREARTWFDRAMKLDRNLRPATVGMAQMYEMDGKPDSALRLLTPYRESNQLTPDMMVVLMRVLSSKGDRAEAIAFAESCLQQELLPIHKRELHMLLGRQYEREGDPAAAMQHLTAGNEAFSYPYSHERTLEQFSTIRSTFATDSPHAATRSSSEARPIFIVGMPRTGSTLLEQILHAHPACMGMGEVSFLRDTIDRVNSITDAEDHFPDCVPYLSSGDYDTLANAYLEARPRAAARSERTVDKALYNFKWIGMIRRMFPHARIIEAYRDPVETCLACFMQNLNPRAHSYSSSLESLGAFYSAYQDLMTYWHDTTSDMLIRMTYEEMVDDSEAQIRRLLEFVELPWDDACLSFHEVRRDVTTISYQQVREPINRKALGRAARFGELIDPLRDVLQREGVSFTG
ncbi:MAG: sulfotransferase [Planctomycetota bacterium]